MSASDPALPQANRACEPCTACCVYLPIAAGLVGPGAKPAGVRCPHLDGHRCRTYARRPRMCVTFRCAWLADPTWPPAWRPDASGLLCLREQLEPGLPAAAVYEIRADALQRPAAAEILEQLRQTTAVFAVINARQERKRLAGDWSTSGPQPAVPRPHFLRSHRTPVVQPASILPLAQRSAGVS